MVENIIYDKMCTGEKRYYKRCKKILENIYDLFFK